MQIISKPEKLFKILKILKLKSKTIGFVPTMGALHEGHLSLIRQAKKENKIVVVSIFVNPKQFGPKEDLKSYPRPLSKDLAFCRKEKVDFIFLPKAKDIYGKNFSTYIQVEGLSSVLCGKARPGHFRGVATIVTKLFNLVHPDIAYLGMKDAQQLIIIKRMVKDLNIPVKIKAMPTVREADGLAISSRNMYLNKSEKLDALVLSRALNLAKLMIKNGARDSLSIVNRMKELIKQNKSVRIEYIEILDTETLRPLNRVIGNYLIVLAVRIGTTRLIDNFWGKLSR